MTDALDDIKHGRGLVIRPGFLQQIRAGKRTHLFLPATFIPGHRTGMAPKANAERRPTPWSKLVLGDRLWVQEELSALVSRRHGEVAEMFYKLDLPGGRVPIPNSTRGETWATKSWPAHLMQRESSRYTLEVTGVRVTPAQGITRAETAREGTGGDPYQTLGGWWQYNYGIVMPWPENHAVVGIDFTFTDGNIDTGVKWEAPPRPTNPNSAATDALFKRSFGTPGVRDD